MYPVGLCPHNLSDVLLHRYSRLLVGPSRLVLGSVRFFVLNAILSHTRWISQQFVESLRDHHPQTFPPFLLYSREIQSWIIAAVLYMYLFRGEKYKTKTSETKL